MGRRPWRVRKSVMAARVKAHEDGEWVREAAVAYAEKRKLKRNVA